KPEEGQVYCFPLAGVHAFLTVGKALIFSEDSIAAYEARVYEDFREMGVPKDVYRRSMDYGKAVADHVLAWADSDNYKETRSYPKYDVTRDPSKWRPTPPDYMDGIEPHWREIRPFLLDSAGQFV
ncbi:hypothetical protein RZS08_01505, partial [Arthrospira platensis SPKY1]|nr:hypothetical protein [Arthrospira platensis SPKY1]